MKYVLLLLLIFFFASCDQPNGNRATGKVVRIADGDTFTWLNENNEQVKVRLHGIDAPERAQDFGQVARQKLSDLVFGQPVRIEVMDTDRYGRTVAIVYTQDGICVNEELLREGLAWHYKQYDDNKEWEAIQQKAKKEKKGLWQQRKPIAPWDWRKGARTENTTKKAA